MLGGPRLMSLIPAFQLGLWNAWILEVLALAGNAPHLLVSSEARAKFFALPPYSRAEKACYFVARYGVGMATLGYSVFLPLKLGTVWFYVGLAIWLLALLTNLIGGINFSTTPLNEPVTKGLYRVSRNPAYLCKFLSDVGIGVACASWVFLLLAMTYIILANILAVSEERFCLEQYGDTYRKYMDVTPRWIAMPRSGED
jgi:protein-S-isoprenylcysteine O-methyltransferase Ste14